MATDNAEFMNGLQLSREFYEEIIKPLLNEKHHAAARLGSGSEVLGFDTPRSTDHGWGPQLQIFVDAEEVVSTMKLIESNLPEDFKGWRVRFGWDNVPETHHIQVATLPRWLENQLGFDPSADLSLQDWLTTPQQLLLEVIRGAVFRDPHGDLDKIRRKLRWYPDDVWLWLLACQWRRIAQEEALIGRTAEVGDELGSKILTARITRELMRLCFLLEKEYMPYGKWLGSAFCTLPISLAVQPHLDRALTAMTYVEREAALCKSYRHIAERFNDLELTEHIDPTPRQYYTRPYRVLGGDRFADACIASIRDDLLRKQPLIGCLDQFVDCVDIQSNPTLSRRIGIL